MVDPYALFRVEVREVTAALAQLLLALERGDAPPDAIASLFRMAHTVKGAASVVQQAGIAELAHIMEDVLAKHQATGVPLSRQEIGELLQVVDGIEAQLAMVATQAEAAREGRADAPADGEAIERVHVELADLDALTRGILEAEAQLEALRASLAALERPEEVAGAGRRARRDAGDRLDAAKAELGQLRQQVDALRIVPAGGIFPVLERAAHDAARSSGRELRCELGGADVRVDRHILSAARDALLHLVRNAVDHGIEPPEERASAGKPAPGRIAIRVERRGRRIAFICEDDGRGIDVAAVRRAAIRRELLDEEQAAALDEDAALRLILRPGLSTSEEVTEVSGRGMGLDVVRETAARIKGELAVTTRRGSGTAFELEVAASLTAVEALAFSAGETAFLAPLDAVAATLRVREADLLRSPERTDILHEGTATPFLALASVLGRSPPRRAPDHPLTILLLRAAGRALALGVDEVHEVVDAVIQPLPAGVDAAPWIAGATLDREGNPALVIDPRALMNVAALGPAAPPAEEPPAPPPPPILVVDDSLTTRMLEQTILQAAGHEVELACSAEEALEKIAARRYGLFIVDVEMPGMNGFELTAKLRAETTTRDIPVILVTSRSSDEDRRRGARAGAAAYVIKSEFDQRRFLQTVGELLTGGAQGDGRARAEATTRAGRRRTGT